jgi:hypothetical protein
VRPAEGDRHVLADGHLRPLGVERGLLQPVVDRLQRFGQDLAGNAVGRERVADRVPAATSAWCWPAFFVVSSAASAAVLALRCCSSCAAAVVRWAAAAAP